MGRNTARNLSKRRTNQKRAKQLRKKLGRSNLKKK